MPVPFWRSDACVVTVGYAADGSLEFHGDDRRAFGTPGHAYEYVVTVPSEQFAALRRALEVDAAADVRAAVVARADDIMTEGERSWLEKHGVRSRVSVWSSPPD